MDYTMLYKDSKSYFRKYVETDETEIGFLALYGTATHLYKNYRAFPLLNFNGDFATGKNRRLDLLNGICLNPIILTNPSLPSLFRSIAEEGCTILIDEADGLLKYNQFESFLLAGYKKGGKISRAKQDDVHPKGFKTVYFDVYCPKVLVTREGIQSEPLSSRAITIITSPKTADSKVPDILPVDAILEGEELKNRIVTMASAQHIVDESDIDLGLIGRDAEIFEAIKHTAIIYGEEAITDLQSFVHSIYVPETRYNTMFSFHEDLIRALVDCWYSGQRIYLQTIHEKLKLMNVDYSDLKIRRIGKVLRSLNFAVRPDNEKTYVERNSKLLDTWRKRYLPAPEVIQMSGSPDHEVDSHTDKSEPIGVDSGESLVELVIKMTKLRQVRDRIAQSVKRTDPRRRIR